MAKRDLELNLRAKADTSDLKKLENETAALVTAMQRTTGAFEAANAEARQLAAAYGSLTAEEKKQIASAAQMEAALSRAAAARERAAQAAIRTEIVESRSVAAQQQSEQAAIRTAKAQEQLVQAQERTQQVVARTAAAEEKLAQERQRTYQAASRTEKSEYDIVRARENARKATAQAEAAELRLEKARRSGSNSLVSVVTNIRNLIAGGAIVLATRQLLDFGRAVGTALKDAATEGAELIVLEDKFNNLAVSIGSSGAALKAALQEASSGMIDNATLMQGASDLISFGLARNVEDAANLTNLISQLRIDPNILNLTLSNDSTMRLDSLGLSIETVKNKIKELKEEGKVGDLFDQAVIAALEDRLALVGDQSDSTAAQIKAMEATAKNASDTFKQAFAGSVADSIRIARGEVDNLDAALQQTAAHYGDLLGNVTSEFTFEIINASLKGQIGELGGDLFEIDAQIDKIRRNTGANMFGTGLDPKQVKFQAEVLAYLSDTLAKLEAAQGNYIEARSGYGAQVAAVTDEIVTATQAEITVAQQREVIERRRNERNQTTVEDMRAYAAAIYDAQAAEERRAAQAERSAAIDERRTAALEAYMAVLDQYQQSAAEGGAFYAEQLDADIPIFRADMTENAGAVNAAILEMAGNLGLAAPLMAELGVATGEVTPQMAEAAVKAAVLNEAIKTLVQDWQKGIIPDAGSLLDQVNGAIEALQNNDLPTLEIELSAKKGNIQLDPGERRALESEGLDVEIPIDGDIEPFETALDNAINSVAGVPEDSRTIAILTDMQAVLDATEVQIPAAVSSIPDEAKTIGFIADTSEVDAAIAGLPTQVDIAVNFVPSNTMGGGINLPLPPGRAAGGPVYSGLPYIVGELGPELFVPGTSGRIVPNGGNLGGAFPQTFEVNQYFYGPAQPEQVRAAVRDASDVFLSQFSRVGGVA